MKTNKSFLVLALTLGVASSSLFAQVDPFVNRHHRSIERIDIEGEAEPAAGKAAPAPKKAQSNQVIDKTGTPPTAKPGECYTRVLVSPTMTTVSERVLVREESFELIEIPAVLETVEERVMVRAASERQEVIPATYKEVEERILKAPAYTRQVPVAAKFENRSERVLVQPERSYWKKGTGPMQKFDGETGEIMCYVTDPAVYRTVTRQVVTQPASVREEQVPAVYETVKRTALDTPAKIKTIPVPAEYAMVKVQKVKSPGRTEKRVIPAEYGKFDRQVSEGQSSLEWRRVLCETNVTPDVISDLQTQLNARNFKVGAVDGVYGRSTEKAVADFQAANNLPQGGLTYETLSALGVKL